MTELPPPSGIETEQPPHTDSPQRLPITVVIAFVATAVALLCSFLPWAHVVFLTVNGTDGDGMITAVASGVSLALLFALLRIQQRRASAAIGCAVTALISLATYGYDLARLSHALGGKDLADNIFGNSISVGFGLVVGAMASGVAFANCVVLVIHIKNSNDVRVAPAGWGHHHAIVVSLAGATFGIAAAERVWVLSICLGVGAMAAFLVFRKTSSFGTPVTAAAVAALLAGLGGGIYGATSSSGASASSECTSIFKAGAAVDAIHDTSTCSSEGKRTFVFTMDDTCYDGSTLYTNKFGWGYSGKTWNVDGEPPRRICQSTAKEKCTTLFADGATTSSSWEFLPQDCFDATGQPTSVSSNIDYCQDFSTMVSNDFGWGKEGEPWHANQPKPATC